MQPAFAQASATQDPVNLLDTAERVLRHIVAPDL